MKVAIITPIQVELDAVLSKVSSYQEKLQDETRYLIAPFSGKHHSFQLILQLGGSKNENTALVTDRLVRNFHPDVVILCGVAGGVKDVAVGDVVIGTKYYGYEFGKETHDGFVARPEAGHYSRELITMAQSVAASADWRKKCSNDKPCKVVFGAIAAGNKVIAATDSAAYKVLKQTYNDTTAIEMEAVGFGEAMRSYPAIRFINIRGISDLLDNKSHADAGGSQELAADNMAALVLELIYRLNIAAFKIFGNMNLKELSKEIIDLVTQLNRADAPLGTKNSLLEVLEPLIGDELKVMKDQPADADAKAEAKSELRRILEGKEELQKQLEAMLERGKEESQMKVAVSNSENVVQGNIMHAGNDITINNNKGDNYNIVNNYYAHPSGQGGVPIAAFDGLKRELRQQIAKGHTGEVLQKLTNLNGQSESFQNSAIHLSGRWAQLKRQEMMGLLGFSEANIERSRINNSVLSLMSELPGE